MLLGAGAWSCHHPYVTGRECHQCCQGESATTERVPGWDKLRRVICCITSSWQLWTSDNVPIHARSQEAMWGSATMATVDTFSASPPSSLFVKKHIYDPRCPPKPPFPPLLIILHLFEILQIFPPERVYEHPRMCME